MLKQKEWIDVIVNKTGCSKKEAKLFYDCVFDYMREQITPEEPIKIQGFGVFKLRKTAAKEQINLITGQPEIVPEHNVVTFKPYFEIDSKPEAIEIEDEDIVEEEIVSVVEEPTIEEEVLIEEVVIEEVAAEEVAPEEDVVEETIVHDEVIEEEVVIEEDIVEEVVESIPQQEVQAEETPVEDDIYTWLLNGKPCTTKVVQKLLQQRTNLPDNQILSALEVVKNNMAKLNTTTCEIKEENETFDFIILK